VITDCVQVGAELCVYSDYLLSIYLYLKTVIFTKNIQYMYKFTLHASFL